MTPQEHYDRAEELLAAGVETVQRISTVADRRNRLNDNRSAWNNEAYARMHAEATQQMDELGKKAMGIWAQAQVHATLAAVPHSCVQVEVANAGDLR